MPFMFENLEVYKKSIALADELSTLTESFPKGNYYWSDQFVQRQQNWESSAEVQPAALLQKYYISVTTKKQNIVYYE